jgi:hypothetical protein
VDVRPALARFSLLNAGETPAFRPEGARMRRLARPFWVALALLFLFEAWLWDSLQPVVGRIVNIIPWGKIKPAFIRWVDRLSPRATLMVFAIPFIVLLPVKFLELWLLANRQWIAAIVVLLSAKIVGLGITSFIFDATRDKLLQMAWFRRVYDFFLWARNWALEKIAPVRQRLKEWSRQTIGPIVLRLRRWKRFMQPRHASRFFQWVMRVRRRMRTAT